MNVKWMKLNPIRRKKIVLLALAVLFLLTLGIKIGKHYAPYPDIPPVIEDGEPIDSTIPINLSDIKIPGYNTVTIPANETSVSVTFENPIGNPCYFQISMYLTATNELVYQSNYLSPGKMLTQLQLNRSFTAGTYPITIRFDTFALDDNYTPLNSAVTAASLVVQ